MQLCRKRFSKETIAVKSLKWKFAWYKRRNKGRKETLFLQRISIKIKAPFQGQKFHQLPVLKLRHSELKVTCPRSVNGLLKSSGLSGASPESSLSVHTIYICTRRKNNQVIFTINLFKVPVTSLNKWHSVKRSASTINMA